VAGLTPDVLVGVAKGVLFNELAVINMLARQPLVSHSKAV
jgi:hypothetical protein